jgi:hypothetical protein
VSGSGGPVYESELHQRSGFDLCRDTRVLVVELGVSPQDLAPASFVARYLKNSAVFACSGAAPQEILQDLLHDGLDLTIVIVRQADHTGFSAPGEHGPKALLRGNEVDRARRPGLLPLEFGNDASDVRGVILSLQEKRRALAARRVKRNPDSVGIGHELGFAAGNRSQVLFDFPLSSFSIGHNKSVASAPWACKVSSNMADARRLFYREGKVLAVFGRPGITNPNEELPLFIGRHTERRPASGRLSFLNGLLPHNPARIFIFAETGKARVPEVPVRRPFGELNLRAELGSDPAAVLHLLGSDF